MSRIEDLLKKMRRNPRNVRFSDLRKICDYYFGKARQVSSSHRIYKMPWQGDPRVNFQNHKGKAKVYQVKQVLLALERYEGDYGTKK